MAAATTEVAAMQARLRAMQEKARLQASGSGRLKRHQKRTQPTLRTYDEEKNLWLRFKACFGGMEIEPDLPTLMLFYHWYARDSKGRIGRRSSLGTLRYKLRRFVGMMEIHYQCELPEDLVEDVRHYIDTELAHELGLEDISYPKEFADWTDVQAMIHYIFALDLHEYRVNRFRVQQVFVLLVFSKTGERPGAILRSSAYRETNEALRYRDVELFMKPSVDKVAPPRFGMHVTFNFRKGERLDVRDYIKVTFEEDEGDILAHCILLIFMTLAFSDEAFADVSTPKDLYSKRNPRVGDLPIRFQANKRDIPILRRLEAIGSNKLSPTLAWDVSSATNDAQRICGQMGYNTRFTYYNIRRAIANEVDGKMSDAQKLQLFGHQDSKDRVYKRWYQSRHFVEDVGSIFRGRGNRSNLSQYLSMHKRRDADAPLQLPDEEEARLYAADANIQNLLTLQCNLQHALSNEPSNSEQAKIRAELAVILLELRSRSQTVTRQGLREFRKRWFEERPGEILRSQGNVDAEGDSATDTPPLVSDTANKLRPDRIAVVEALFPSQDQPAVSRVVALERLITYCQNNMGNLGTQRVWKVSRLPTTDVIASAWSRAECSIVEKFSLLLARPSSMGTTDWQQVLVELPGRSPQAIIKQSWLTRTGRVNTLKRQTGSVRTAESSFMYNQRHWTEEETEIVRQHSESLSHPSTITEERWKQLCQLLPQRTRKSITQRSYQIRKMAGKTCKSHWTEEDITVLQQSAETLAHFAHPSTMSSGE